MQAGKTALTLVDLQLDTMIFHNGALIEANSTMPTPIAMSTSEAEYMAACSATMATAHIRMLLYDMLYSLEPNNGAHPLNAYPQFQLS